MRRRTVIRAAGTVAAAAVAGCTSTSPADRSPAPTPMPPTLTDATLSVRNANCGEQTNAATISFDEDAVTASGTIWGSDAGRTATLADASFDRSASELTLTVTTADREDGGDVAAQCITEIDYEVRATFEGSLPDSVTVVHVHGDDESTVATASRQ